MIQSDSDHVIGRMIQSDSDHVIGQMIQSDSDHVIGRMIPVVLGLGFSYPKFRLEIHRLPVYMDKNKNKISVCCCKLS